MNTEFAGGEPRKALVVDDDAGFLQVVSTLLTSAGYEVDTAESGMEAIRKFRREASDVVITDRAMPQMDGEQMTEVIKTIEPDIPVILMTGLPESVRHPDLFIAVLPKPFRSGYLLDLMETALQGKARAA